jgi:hypothetical protein
VDGSAIVAVQEFGVTSQETEDLMLGQIVRDLVFDTDAVSN